MKKILHTLLAVILMLALPLQGFAASGMAETCHHDHEQVVELHGSALVVQQHLDQQSAASNHSDHQHFDEGKKADKDDCSCCSNCCSSCAQAMLGDASPVRFSSKLLVRVLVADTSPSSSTPERLDRPPAGNRSA